MLSSLKAAGATFAPRLFALASIPADWRAAANNASELNLLPMLVERGDAACDIGANRGLFTYWLLRLGARVTAIEPNPGMVRILNYRFGRAIADGRLNILDYALSDSDDRAVLHVPHDKPALGSLDGQVALDDAQADAMVVTCRRLDECLDGPVDFMKIDVEGHEARVLAGAHDVLAAHRPTLLVEAEERHRPGAVASLREMLEPLGYQGFFAQADGMHRVETFDPAVHQRSEALNAEGTGAIEPFGYANNFVFTTRPRVRERLEAWAPGSSSVTAALS